MTLVAGRLVHTLFFCCAMITSVHAQTAETESTSDKYFRLSKEADENPTDWNTQLEVAHLLLDKESALYNQARAGRYYERIYHLATDYNKEVPDSVIRESILALTTLATDKKDLKKALFYIDELIHAEKVGVEISDMDIISYDVMGILYNIIGNDAPKALSHMLDMRQRVTDNNMPGIEYSDAFTAMLYENLMGQYQKMFGDKLLELTLDGKKYIFIAMKDWNIERPLMGWLGTIDNEDKHDLPKLLYGEDGKVYDDLHGEANYSFKYDKEGIVPQEGYNIRMITVTPEQRQQLVDAYHSYMKKHKKDMKK